MAIASSEMKLTINDTSTMSLIKTKNLDFHALLSLHIHEKGMKQKHIAERLGVSTTFLSRLKQDSFPLFDTLLELCLILGLDRKEKRELIRHYILARIHPEGRKANAYLRE